MRVDILHIKDFEIKTPGFGPNEALVFKNGIPLPILNRIPVNMSVWQIVSLEVWQDPWDTEKVEVNIVSTVSTCEGLTKYLNDEYINDPVDIDAIKAAKWRVLTDEIDEELAEKIKDAL